MTINLVIRLQKYLKPDEKANVDLISIIEIGIDALKNFIEGPYRRNQDDLSRSRVLNSLKKIMFHE